MEWLLVICMLIVFWFVYLAMKRIDKFIERSNVFVETKNGVPVRKPYVLVFGYSELADKLILLLNSNETDYVQIDDENQLDKSKYYSHLFAISSNDLNNLLISVIINRRNEAYEKIAICNSIHNKNIYEQNDIRYLCAENLEAEVLFNIMFPSIDKENSNAKEN